MRKSFVLLPLALAALAACEAPTQTSGSVYRPSEVGVAMPSARQCTVIGARQVRIASDRTSGGQILGTATGAIVGGAIGSNIGGGSGRNVATALGVIGGAAAGSRITSEVEAGRGTNAVEYTVRLDRSDQVVVQALSAGERVLPVGTSCRFVGGGRNARVLPF